MSEAATVCKYHPNAAATGSCVQCEAVICDVCTAFGIDGVICTKCKARAWKAKRNRRYAMLGVALVGLGFLSPTIYRSASKKLTDIRDGAPAIYKGKLAPLAEALDKEPCDRRKIVDFCDELLAEGEPQYCLVRADRFFAQCGDYVRLR